MGNLFTKSIHLTHTHKHKHTSHVGNTQEEIKTPGFSSDSSYTKEHLGYWSEKGKVRGVLSYY